MRPPLVFYRTGGAGSAVLDTTGAELLAQQTLRGSGGKLDRISLFVYRNGEAFFLVTVRNRGRSLHVSELDSDLGESFARVLRGLWRRPKGGPR